MIASQRIIPFFLPLEASNFHKNIERWRTTTTSPYPSICGSNFTIFTPAESVDNNPTTPTDLQPTEDIDLEESALGKALLCLEQYTSMHEEYTRVTKTFNTSSTESLRKELRQEYTKKENGLRQEHIRSISRLQNINMRITKKNTKLRSEINILCNEQNEYLQALEVQRDANEVVTNENSRLLTEITSLERNRQWEHTQAMEELHTLELCKKENDQLIEELKILRVHPRIQFLIHEAPETPIFTGEDSSKLPRFIAACEARFRCAWNSGAYETEESKMNYVISRLRDAPWKHYKWRLDGDGRLLKGMSYGAVQGVFDFLIIYFGPRELLNWGTPHPSWPD